MEELAARDANVPGAGTVDFYSFSYYMSATASLEAPEQGRGNVLAAWATRTSNRATGAGPSTPRGSAGTSSRSTAATKFP